MSYKKLLRRLGMEIPPSSGKRARLKDYILSIDLAFAPPTEPVFASLLPSPGNSVYGVVYELTSEQYKKLYTSEGGPHGGYTEHVVFPEILDDTGESSGKVQAIAFKTKSYWAVKLPHAMKPSLRYKNMLVDGAKEANLPDHYVDKLIQIQAARPVGYYTRVLIQLQYITVFAFAKSQMGLLIALVGYTRPVAGFVYGVGELLRETAPGPIASILEQIASFGLLLLILPFSVVGALIAASQGRLKKVVKSVDLTNMIDDHVREKKIAEELVQSKRT